MEKEIMKKTLICCLLALVLTFSLAACSGKCEHVYDDCADTECDLCGNTRDSMHSFKEADCITPKTCTVCQKTEGVSLGHTPEPDDRDCTTELKCLICKNVIVEATTHTPEADDGNCTTDIKCSVCETLLFSGADKHSDTDGDFFCDNTGCQITVDGAPKDESTGTDLPIDPN